MTILFFSRGTTPNKKTWPQIHDMLLKKLRLCLVWQSHHLHVIKRKLLPKLFMLERHLSLGIYHYLTFAPQMSNKLKLTRFLFMSFQASYQNICIMTFLQLCRWSMMLTHMYYIILLYLFE